MKDAARPDPVAAAHRVKEGVRDLARGALGAAGDLASDVAGGYRKSTRYFKLRAAVVGTWALLAIVTIWAACPSSGPTNPLGAKTKLLAAADSLLGPQVFVENESDRMWRDVVVTLEGGWRYEKKTVRPSENFVVPLNRFSKDGTTAPASLPARTITIECAEGRVTIPLLVAR